jgi:hypothetical protein
VTALRFAVLGARPEPYALAPTIVFRLRATEPSAAAVHALVLRVQVRVEPQRRGYAAGEAEALVELFGEPSRFAETLRPFPLAQLSTATGGFVGETELELSLPCTYDFEVAATKYLAALADGVVPLAFLFSGTVFCRRGGARSVEPVDWSCEAAFGLPVAVWREAVERAFPGTGFLRLRRSTLDALARRKAEWALTSFDELLEVLLETARAVEGAGRSAAVRPTAPEGRRAAGPRRGSVATGGARS